MTVQPLPSATATVSATASATPSVSTTATANPSGLSASSAADALAHVRIGMKRCFNAALKNDPKLHATIQLEIHVAPDGSVENVVPSATPSIPNDLEQCFVSVTKPIVFEAPGGTGAVLRVPINLVPQTP